MRNSRLVRLGLRSLVLMVFVGACSSSANTETATPFGRACRALGDADAVLFKSNWPQIQRDYARVGAEAPGIGDASVRAAAVAIAAKITKHAPDVDLARIIGGDPDDARLASACASRYGDDY
jgi:hypothetical protein